VINIRIRTSEHAGLEFSIIIEEVSCSFFFVVVCWSLGFDVNIEQAVTLDNLSVIHVLLTVDDGISRDVAVALVCVDWAIRCQSVAITISHEPTDIGLSLVEEVFLLIPSSILLLSIGRAPDDLHVALILISTPVIVVLVFKVDLVLFKHINTNVLVLDLVTLLLRRLPVGRTEINTHILYFTGLAFF
jgi:hypothetical protein